MEISRRSFVKLLGAATAGTAVLSLPNLLAAQKKAVAARPGEVHPWFTPNPPAFPSFTDRTAVIAEAQRISNRLEQYIKDWFDGRVPAQIPSDIVPTGVDTNYYGVFTLVRAEDIRPEEQWGIRAAEEIDTNGLRGSFPDPHCTYMVIPAMFVPFGSRVIMEGDFPHCRFFDVQVTPTFQPENYRYNGSIGVGEVPLVDADIKPELGSVNPFLAGANRTAKRRRYKLTFDMAIGNPVDLNPAFHPPYYRAQGNNRKGGAIFYQGAWGDPASRPWGHGRGFWDVGSLWVRYYAPDRNRDALGGVALPKITYQLPDGRRFYIKNDLTRWNQIVNKRKPVRWTLPEDPNGFGGGPLVGWGNQMGIFRSIVSGFSQAYGADQAYVRALDKGVAGRGEDLPAPGNYEPSATSCTYINYLNRGMSIDWGKVIVITGKMPTTPKTRGGETRMTTAQARYWSITSYDIALPDEDGYAGAAIHSLMDDEITLDDQNRYIIVYSWGWTRPNNARAENGVTWKDWTPTGRQTFTIRWLSVHPEWSFNLAPNEANLGWRADWASTIYNRNLIGNNNQNGFLREYQPRMLLIGKEQFESLGNRRLTPEDIPIWT